MRGSNISTELINPLNKLKMDQKINITLKQLGSLLNQQKRIVINRLSGSSSSYNSTNTASTVNSLPIDKTKFEELGMSSAFPDDYETLIKYID